MVEKRTYVLGVYNNIGLPPPPPPPRRDLVFVMYWGAVSPQTKIKFVQYLWRFLMSLNAPSLHVCLKQNKVVHINLFVVVSSVLARTPVYIYYIYR